MLLTHKGVAHESRNCGRGGSLEMITGVRWSGRVNDYGAPWFWGKHTRNVISAYLSKNDYLFMHAEFKKEFSLFSQQFDKKRFLPYWTFYWISSLLGVLYQLNSGPLSIAYHIWGHWYLRHIAPPPLWEQLQRHLEGGWVDVPEVSTIPHLQVSEVILGSEG